MKRKIIVVMTLFFAVLLGGCGEKNSASKTAVSVEKDTEFSTETVSEKNTNADVAQSIPKLPDGTYTAEFITDSSMFHVSEACEGKGTLTVVNGEMTLHVSLASKKILNLYPGLAKDAAKEGAELLYPTVDTVTYSDGMTEEVHGFDIPVPSLETEFDLALIGTKGKWYDHKVRVCNPVLSEETKASQSPQTFGDGTYRMEITFAGGTGKAKILSPVTVTITDQKAIATIQWNSPNYDYMLVDGEKYLPTNTEGNSVFEIPVAAFDEPINIIGDTVAMSKPHEVEYTITFHSDTIKQQNGLVLERSMDLQYAKQFAVDYYENGYVMLRVTDDRKYLIVPEGMEAPENLEKDIILLKRPFDNIYLVASAVMDMFCELDALDTLRFSGQKEDGWSIPQARDAMKNGTVLYAGKYNMPDYELIVSEGCSLAIENSMILHSPEVIEKLEDFGIPVLIDQSSHENHPLGRVEWIKLYGALLGKEEEAQAAFEKQVQSMEKAAADTASGKTVAFFYITTNGMVNVRTASDYVPKMISLAGGKYIFDDLGDNDNKHSTMTMQMEEFYHSAKDADYLIYNSTIDGELKNLDVLLQKEALLKDFKAVQNGKVWCTTQDMYQQSMSIGQMIEDIHSMLSDDASSQGNIVYLYPLD